jgi:hypothetical protein
MPEPGDDPDADCGCIVPAASRGGESPGDGNAAASVGASKFIAARLDRGIDSAWYDVKGTLEPNSQSGRKCVSHRKRKHPEAAGSGFHPRTVFKSLLAVFGAR